MPSDMKITPYKCRTLHLEYKDIVERRKSAVDFIVKSDLWDLAKNIGHDTLRVEEIVHLCMGVFVKVADLYESTHEYFQNYLDGIGTINDTNKMALGLGLKSCQDEILRENITTSPILNYIYFSLVNNRSKRDEISNKEMLDELIVQLALTNTSNVGDSLKSLNIKVQEISQIVGRLSSANMEFDVSDSMRLLDGVGDKLISMEREQDKQIENINKQVTGLKSKIQETGGKVENLSTQAEDNANRFGLIMRDIENRLAQESQRAGYALERQKEIERGMLEGDAQINNLTSRLSDALEGLEEIFTDNQSTASLLETISGIQDYVAEFQGSVRMQTLMTKEIDEKVRTVEEGLSVVKQVLDSLNAIMREDILINLARSSRGITDTARGVEAIGTKYKEIREGGYM